MGRSPGRSLPHNARAGLVRHRLFNGPDSNINLHVFIIGTAGTIQSFASLNGKLKWAGETIVRVPAWATIYVQDWTFDAGGPDNPLHLAGTATVQLAERAGGWVGLIDDFNSQG